MVFKNNMDKSYNEFALLVKKGALVLGFLIVSGPYSFVQGNHEGFLG
jgi:hypothetical protein